MHFHNIFYFFFCFLKCTRQMQSSQKFADWTQTLWKLFYFNWKIWLKIEIKFKQNVRFHFRFEDRFISSMRSHWIIADVSCTQTVMLLMCTYFPYTCKCFQTSVASSQCRYLTFDDQKVVVVRQRKKNTCSTWQKIKIKICCKQLETFFVCDVFISLFHCILNQNTCAHSGRAKLSIRWRRMEQKYIKIEREVLLIITTDVCDIEWNWRLNTRMCSISFLSFLSISTHTLCSVCSLCENELNSAVAIKKDTIDYRLIEIVRIAYVLDILVFERYDFSFVDSQWLRFTMNIVLNHCSSQFALVCL